MYRNLWTLQALKRLDPEIDTLEIGQACETGLDSESTSMIRSPQTTKHIGTGILKGDEACFRRKKPGADETKCSTQELLFDLYLELHNEDGIRGKMSRVSKH